MGCRAFLLSQYGHSTAGEQTEGWHICANDMHAAYCGALILNR